MYGKARGLRAVITVRGGARIERVISNLSLLTFLAEECDEVRLVGLIRPPIDGLYTLYIESLRSPTIRFEDRLVPLRAIGSGRYLSTPIKMCADGFYMLEILYRCSECGPIKRIDILREDGVVEPITNHAYAPLSNEVTILGLPPSSKVVAKSIGVISTAYSDERGVAAMKLPDAKPPLSLCIEVETPDRIIELGCLSDVWGGDVYQMSFST